MLRSLSKNGGFSTSLCSLHTRQTDSQRKIIIFQPSPERRKGRVNIMAKKDNGRLLIAFPTGHNELRVVFSQAVDRSSAEQPQSYSTKSGLKILGAYLNPDDPKRVTLRTDPMDGDAMTMDVLRASGVRTAAGKPLSANESPRFIQGI